MDPQPSKMSVEEKKIHHLINDMTREEIYQARLIVAQTQFWTPALEKLLRRWKRQINLRREGHKLAERSYSKKYYFLGVPATVCSTVVASGILSTFKNCDECGSLLTTTSGSATTIPIGVPTISCASDEWIRLVMGILAVFSLILSALMVFMDYGGAREANKQATDSCDELSRDIEGVLNTPISRRGDPVEKLHYFRNRFDDIKKASPSIPAKYEVSLEYHAVVGGGGMERKKSSKSLKAKAKSEPIEMATTAPERLSPKKIAKIAHNAAKNVLDEQRRETKFIEQANDYDTDEENREVAIPFDIEEFRPDDILERQRKDGLKSLSKALEFELTRMYSSEARPLEKYSSESRALEKVDCVVPEQNISSSEPKRKKKVRAAKGEVRIDIGSQDKGKEEEDL